jgi:hypothetical protein
MARLTGPLYGSTATGTVAGLLGFRTGQNTQCVARLPSRVPRPSAAQILQRQKYRDAIAAWNMLSDADRAQWIADTPEGQMPIPFFISCYLLS